MVAYALLVFVVRRIVFALAVIVAVLAIVDWAVRTRRISPFSGIARFCRRVVDPMLVPVERTVIRAGGRPAAAPWWMLVAVVIAGLILIYLLDFVGGLLNQLTFGFSQPALLPVILLSWGFKLIELALIVRVISSWLPISPFSRWIRWSYVLTDWFILPLRRIIPTIGMIDITPLVAYLLLAYVLEPAILSGVRSAIGV
jgi:YggT family protein